eukprot:gene3930-2798_t
MEMAEGMPEHSPCVAFAVVWFAQQCVVVGASSPTYISLYYFVSLQRSLLVTLQPNRNTTSVAAPQAGAVSNAAITPYTELTISQREQVELQRLLEHREALEQLLLEQDLAVYRLESEFLRICHDCGGSLFTDGCGLASKRDVGQRRRHRSSSSTSSPTNNNPTNSCTNGASGESEGVPRHTPSYEAFAIMRKATPEAARGLSATPPPGGSSSNPASPMGASPASPNTSYSTTASQLQYHRVQASRAYHARLHTFNPYERFFSSSSVGAIGRVEAFLSRQRDAAAAIAEEEVGSGVETEAMRRRLLAAALAPPPPPPPPATAVPILSSPSPAAAAVAAQLGISRPTDSNYPSAALTRSATSAQDPSVATATATATEVPAKRRYRRRIPAATATGTAMTRSEMRRAVASGEPDPPLLQLPATRNRGGPRRTGPTSACVGPLEREMAVESFRCSALRVIVGINNNNNNNNSSNKNKSLLSILHAFYRYAEECELINEKIIMQSSTSSLPLDRLLPPLRFDDWFPWASQRSRILDILPRSLGIIYLSGNRHASNHTRNDNLPVFSLLRKTGDPNFFLLNFQIQPAKTNKQTTTTTNK